MCKGLRVLTGMAWMLAFLWGVPATAETGCEHWAAKLVSVQGRVEVKRVGAAAWQSAAVGHLLCDGDQIHVAALSRAAVWLPSETVLRLDQERIPGEVDSQERGEWHQFDLPVRDDPPDEELELVQLSVDVLFGIRERVLLPGLALDPAKRYVVFGMPGLVACIIDNPKEEPEDLVRGRADLDRVGQYDVFQ